MTGLGQAAEGGFADEAEVVLTAGRAEGKLLIGEEWGEVDLGGFGIRASRETEGPIEFGDIDAVKVVDAELAFGVVAIFEEVGEGHGDDEAEDGGDDGGFDQGKASAPWVEDWMRGIEADDESHTWRERSSYQSRNRPAGGVIRACRGGI